MADRSRVRRVLSASDRNSVDTHPAIITAVSIDRLPNKNDNGEYESVNDAINENSFVSRD